MLNQFVVVGRIAHISIEDDNPCLVLQVNRSTKNENGYYDIDVLVIDLRKCKSNEAIKQLEERQLVGIKGSIESYVNNDTSVNMRLVAEKLTFLNKGE